jgi:hypothetical protein
MRQRLADLLIDDRRCGLRVRHACSFGSRLLGFWPTPRWHGADVVEFPGCRAIHSLAMIERIDVVFVDGEGKVLRLISQLPPWRVVADSLAVAEFEFRAGAVRALGVELGSRLQTHDRRP